jgi:protein TonB
MTIPLDRPQLFDHLLASKPQGERRSTLAALSTSAAGHAFMGAALVWATMAKGDVVKPDDVMPLIPVPVEQPTPPPPPPPLNVDMKDVAPVDLPKGFQILTVPTIVPPDIPPPDVSRAPLNDRDWSGTGTEGGVDAGNPDLKKVDPEDVTRGISFTPYTLAPALENQAEVARLLERNYPPLLRDAGIGGTTLVWFLIDEQGTVVKTELKKGSGYEALDEVALKVANVMRFQPARNRDQIVKVWVQIPIKFTAR